MQGQKFACSRELSGGELTGLLEKTNRGEKKETPHCGVSAGQLAFAEGSFETSRNDTVSPSSW